MNPQEYAAREAEVAARISDLIDENFDLLGPQAELDAFGEAFADWDSDLLKQFNDAHTVGWVLVIERHDPMQARSAGFIKTIHAPMQSPAHTAGQLAMAMNDYQNH